MLLQLDMHFPYPNGEADQVLNAARVRRLIREYDSVETKPRIRWARVVGRSLPLFLLIGGFLHALKMPRRQTGL